MTSAIEAARRLHVPKRGAHTDTQHLCASATPGAPQLSVLGSPAGAAPGCCHPRTAPPAALPAPPARRAPAAAAWTARRGAQAFSGHESEPGLAVVTTPTTDGAMHMQQLAAGIAGPIKLRSSHLLPAHLHGHQSADLVAPRPRVEVRIALLIRQLLHHALDTHLRPAGRRWWAAATGWPASSSACRIAGGGGVRPGRTGQAARARACPPVAAGAPTKRRWRRGGSPPAACPAARGGWGTRPWSSGQAWAEQLSHSGAV